MVIPEKVRVCGVDYAIVHEDRLNDGEKMAYGCVAYDKSRILLAAQDKGTQIQEIALLHELVHAILRHYVKEVDHVYDEEEAAELISNGMYAIIKDNPGMFNDIDIEYEDVTLYGDDTVLHTCRTLIIDGKRYREVK